VGLAALLGLPGCAEKCMNAMGRQASDGPAAGRPMSSEWWGLWPVMASTTSKSVKRQNHTAAAIRTTCVRLHSLHGRPAPGPSHLPATADGMAARDTVMSALTADPLSHI